MKIAIASSLRSPWSGRAIPRPSSVVALVVVTLAGFSSACSDAPSRSGGAGFLNESVGSTSAAIDIAAAVSGPLYVVSIDSIDTIQPATQWPTCQPVPSCQGDYLCTVDYDYHAPIAEAGADGLPLCPAGTDYNGLWADRGEGDLLTDVNGRALAYLPASDALWVSLAATSIDAFGQPSAVRADHLGCPVGETWGRTLPGGSYTACQSNPDPANTHTSFTLDPIAVAPDETLSFALGLSVVRPRDNTQQIELVTVASGSSTGSTLVTEGMIFSAFGSVAAVLGPGGQIAGSVFSAVGSVLSLAGTFFNGTIPQPFTYATDVDRGCPVPSSVIPAFNIDGTPPDAPTDATSPVLRTQLDGRALFASTTSGDFTFSFGLDFGGLPTTTLCRRPHTMVNMRIRRVGMEQYGGGFAQRSSTIAAPQPDQADAFGFDPHGHLVHAAFNVPGQTPLTWRTGDAPGVPGREVPIFLGGHIMWVFEPLTVFAPDSNVASFSRAPGYVGLSAIAQGGSMQVAERGSNGWTAWTGLASSVTFAPGAPTAVAVLDPEDVSLFAVAVDGSIQRFSGTCTDPTNPCTPDEDALRWSSATTYAPAGTVAADTAANGGGIAAVPIGSAANVFVFGGSWGSCASSLTYANGSQVRQGTFLSATGGGFCGGGGIAAIARGEAAGGNDQIELFAIDSGGIVQTTTLSVDEIWLWELERRSGLPLSAPQALTTSATLSVPGAPLAVVSRKVDLSNTDDLVTDRLANHDHVDVFTVGQNGLVVDAPWVAGENDWNWLPSASYVPNNGTQPIQIAPADASFGKRGSPIGAVAPYPGAIFVSAPRADGSLVQLWLESSVYEPTPTNEWQSAIGSN